MDKWLAAEPFSAIRGIVLVVPGGYGISPLSTDLNGPYCCFHIDRFYRYDLLKL